MSGDVDGDQVKLIRTKSSGGGGSDVDDSGCCRGRTVVRNEAVGSVVIVSCGRGELKEN